MTNLRDAEMRSTMMSERIRQRTDHALRDLVADFDSEKRVADIASKELSAFAGGGLEQYGNVAYIHVETGGSGKTSITSY